MGKEKCEYCGKIYEKQVAWQKYCQAACRIAAWATRKIKKENVEHGN